MNEWIEEFVPACSHWLVTRIKVMEFARLDVRLALSCRELQRLNINLHS